MGLFANTVTVCVMLANGEYKQVQISIPKILPKGIDEEDYIENYITEHFGSVAGFTVG